MGFVSRLPSGFNAPVEGFEQPNCIRPNSGIDCLRRTFADPQSRGNRLKGPRRKKPDCLVDDSRTRTRRAIGAVEGLDRAIVGKSARVL